MTTIKRNARARTTRGGAWTAGMVLCLGAAGVASARPKPTLEPPAMVEIQAEAVPMQRLQRERTSITLEQAIEMARRQYPGRVVRADTLTRNGRVVHEIRILGDDSRVRTVQIDAESTAQR